ncbi:MAG: tRNA dihydrouridine synthase DusB [Gammaproteobacteria bacterium]|nr:tRNA dihydrouridine synthase DusB [Gammaproteobacteria bacterium]
MSLIIGPYEMRNRLVLAPMAGVTDRPFRHLCRNHGAGLTPSEMLTADTRLWSTTKSRRRLDYEDEPGPIVVQIAGAEPRMLATAAREAVSRGAQIIDINMGCPAKKVCRRLAGSALLKDEDLVERILDAVVDSVDVPVTLKIRTGWDKDHRNGLRIARIAERCGILALAIHGRTRACRFQGEAEYQTIRHIKQAVSIPIIANGDIDSPQKAVRVLRETKADGIMIGRAAQGRPWLFSQIDFYFRYGKLKPALANHQVRDIMLAHLQNLYRFYGEYTGVRVARKHLGWYFKTCGIQAQVRNKAVRVETAKEQEHLVETLFSTAEEYKNPGRYLAA